MLSKEHEVKKKHNRRILIQILKAIKFLGRQGLALRSDSDEPNCNFIQALKAFDSGEITKWLLRKTNKHTRPEIQNEVLKIMGLNVL